MSLIIALSALILLAVIIVGLVAWRKDGKWIWLSWMGAAAGAGIGMCMPIHSYAHSIVQAPFAIIFVPSWALGILCYSLMRWRRSGYPPKASWIACQVCSFLPALAVNVILARDSLTWVLVIFLVLPALLVILALALRKFAALSSQPSEYGTANEQDKQLVRDMLREGKVTGDQAADLLKALGPAAPPADRLPMTDSVMGAVGGAVLVAIGFMLPWAYVNMNGIHGYQAGSDVKHGWIILIASILPATLICIPALDKHVRQGLLRAVFASIGGAFLLPLLLRSPMGIGLWVAAAGFGLQLFTALGGRIIPRTQANRR